MEPLRKRKASRIAGFKSEATLLKEQAKAERALVKKQKLAAKKASQYFIEAKRLKEQREAKVKHEKYKQDMQAREDAKLPTRQINTAELISVRIDASTVIYIKPGRDPEAAKRRYAERHQAGRIRL